MGYIYVVSNKVNPKRYVGLTERSIDQRWNEHLRDAYKKKSDGSYLKDYALYRAIRKYGREYFWIEQLEECPSDKLDEREIFWINYLDTFYNGYNETKGGRLSPLQEDYSRLKFTFNGKTIIYNSAEELGNLLSVHRGFSKSVIKKQLSKIPNNIPVTFLGITLEKINGKEKVIESSLQEKESFLINFQMSFARQEIRCIEDQKVFSSIGQAAKYYAKTEYTGHSLMPIQTIIVRITKSLRTGRGVDSIRGKHFEYTGKTFKQKTSQKVAVSKSVKCLELNKEFNSGMEAARFMSSSEFWNCSVKNAKLRISDLINKKIPSYKGYHFEKIT